MRILVTGAAGFIGAELSILLLQKGHTVVGVDNLNDYYDVSLKKDRLHLIESSAQAQNFNFTELDLANRPACRKLFEEHKFEVVVHLAAQAGVRYSIENPDAYVDANLTAFGNVLEGCRHGESAHLIFASSSSVYGANKNFPFSEQDRVDNPVSMYAATKKANELMAHAYAHLYKIPCTGLRFFTVYGPWGRPDMAPFRFAQRMLKEQAIPVYNNGQMIRDFTYIDDIVHGVEAIVSQGHKCKADEVPYKIYNIGRGQPVELMEFISALEKALGVAAIIDYLPMQDGDVPRTMANTEALQNDYGYSPSISVDEGTQLFADWYKGYYSG